MFYLKSSYQLLTFIILISMTMSQTFYRWQQNYQTVYGGGYSTSRGQQNYPPVYGGGASRSQQNYPSGNVGGPLNGQNNSGSGGFGGGVSRVVPNMRSSRFSDQPIRFWRCEDQANGVRVCRY